MDIFKPNNHSKWKIDYKPASKEELDLLKSVFLENYSKEGCEVISIEQVSEVEINSNNFKILSSENGREDLFLLRRYPQSRNMVSIMGSHEAMAFLRKAGLKVPEIIPAVSGKFIIEKPPYYYSLFKFIKADHFRGTIEEIESSAAEFGKMDSLLARFPEADKLKEMVAFQPNVLELRSFSVLVWKKIFSKAEEEFKKSGDEFSGKLLSFKDFILEAVNKTPPDIYDSLPKQVIHFDLHPHNLLTDGRSLLAVLDFDSLRYFEKIRGVAFALHRLVRQHVVFMEPQNLKTAVNHAKEAFLGAYQKENPLSSAELGLISYFLRHEALSRLSYAMKDLYFNGKADWKADLDKQTSAIAEAEYFE